MTHVYGYFLSFLKSLQSGSQLAIHGEASSAAEVHYQKALAFTKENIMHREVEITVESCNKGGSMIGWLFVGNLNLSLALVKEGLAKVHRSAERSEYFKQLQQAEKEAKDKKINVNITILNE